MVRSFPEKTFEHWASQYLTYRFRTHLSLWWPTAGADVVVDPRMLPVGKAIWLELKVSEPQLNLHDHVVTIDVPQLLAYENGENPPDYYVFPHPGWHGVLGTPDAAPWLAGVPAPDLAFRRSGDRWFGNWTRVVPGASLRHALRENGAIGQSTAQLGQWNGTVWTWGPAFVAPVGTTHPEWSWPDFWHSWERCGGPAMPAALVLPDRGNIDPDAEGLVDRDDLTRELRALGRVARSTHRHRDSVERRAIESRDRQYTARVVYLPQYGDDGRPTGKYVPATTAIGTSEVWIDAPPEDNPTGRAPVLTMLPADGIK